MTWYHYISYQCFRQVLGLDWLFAAQEVLGFSSLACAAQKVLGGKRKHSIPTFAPLPTPFLTMSLDTNGIGWLITTTPLSVQLSASSGGGITRYLGPEWPRFLD